MSLLKTVFFLTAVASKSIAQTLIDLSGPGWTLKDGNGSISIPAQVPNQAYVDLYNNGNIGNPIYGMNETAEMWVQLTNWTYISQPLTSLKAGNGASTYLIFEGLDTFTDVSLCNQTLGSTNNQFRQWTFDVTTILAQCKGQPRLAISFLPAVPETHAISNGPDADGDDNFADSCNANNTFGCKAYARKEQNDFGWDWSPHLAPAGPWRPITAVQLTKKTPVYVNNIDIDIYRHGQMPNLVPDQSQPWVFNASLDFLGDLPAGSKLNLALQDASGKQVLSTPLTGVYSNNMTITGTTTIDPSKVSLWWPAGYGAQTLYNATVTITNSKGTTLTSVVRPVGFRTILLNLNPITQAQIVEGIQPGANWHFEINGHEIYIKGSNLVPPSPFWPTVNETKIRQLFELAVQGNQNMFRVWASGAYLDDWIYDIADEMGILLWSEFEFSDAEYPNTTAYLQNYEAEAYYNVRRLNHHPSLAVWVGGNELEQIILFFFFGSDIMTQYEQIFLELFIKCVYANTHSISYMPSSTYNGYLSLDFDRVMPQIPRYKNTSGPNYLYANSDYYNYDATQAFNLSAYPVARFADEFGFHSMPSLQAWESETPPSDLYLESPTVVYHNRHYAGSGSDEEQSLAGIEEMIQAVEMYYPTPDWKDSVANFSAWIYATQVFQADVYQHQIAFYRRGSGLGNRQLGALYWMFEDLWAAPTWASIDVLGRQKIVYYTAKDIYQPVIVYAYYNISTTETEIWVTSDLWSSVSGTVTAEWFTFAGKSLSVPADSSTGNSSTAYVRRDGDASTSSTSAGTSTSSEPSPSNGKQSTKTKSTGTTSTQPTGAAKPTQSASFKVGPINATEVFHYTNLNSTLHSSNANANNAVLRLTVTAHSADGKAYNHTSFFQPGNLSLAPLQDPGLKVTHNGSGSFTVTATKAVAAWVWLDYTSTAVQGYWSSNGFWLAKGESRTVTFTVFQDWSGGAWAQTVGVRSLWDNVEH